MSSIDRLASSARLCSLLGRSRSRTAAGHCQFGARFLLMARLHIMNLEGRTTGQVTLSRRNLLTLLQKLDMAGSMRQIENNDCCEDGVQTPFYPHELEASDLPRTTLVLRCEDDAEHYAKRPAGPGLMHPATERFVQEQGGIAGEALSVAPQVEPTGESEERERVFAVAAAP